MACQQGTLTLRDTWFRPPLWDLLELQFLRTDFSNLPCLNSTFHLEYSLVLSRFCFFFNVTYLKNTVNIMSHHNVRFYFAETIDICTGSNVHWMNATLRSHFSTNRHNLVNPANKQRTMEFIRDYMKNDLKLDIHLDTFTTPGDRNVGLKNYHRMLRRLSRRSCCPDSIILRYCCNRKYEDANAN